MGVVDMSSNPPPPPPPHYHHQTKDLFPSPALSLSLAGIFRGGGGGANTEEVEEGEELGSGRLINIIKDNETTVEISSENSGPLRSRSDDEFEAAAAAAAADPHDDDDHLLQQDNDDDDDDDDQTKKKKKRKKYHRHTAQQIREMEALFKESPHPDEKQRQQLSKQLGLHPRQVKFWFQNRRTQIKAIQERHENALLKSELEKFRDENKTLRETFRKASCPNCGFSTSSSSTKDIISSSDHQHLRIENARLKSEVEKLRAAVGKYTLGGGTSLTSPNNNEHNSSWSSGAGNDPATEKSRSCYPGGPAAGIFGIDKSGTMEIVNRALEELNKMATAGEPLWIRSLETGREILNYDEYMKEFPVDNNNNNNYERRRIFRRTSLVEASRDSGIVFLDLPRLIQTFTDVNLWKDMFPCMISKAATIDTICMGESGAKDGLVQLMFAELQMLTPMVPTREVYFVRYSKQLSADRWAIVDISIDKVEGTTTTTTTTIDASSSFNKCRKLASGCIIEDKSNGHCKVTWVEHLECQRGTVVHALYRTVVNGGLAFGARHWMATLQLQCERLVFFMATNVPTKDSTGVTTLAGRKSLLQLAQRMTVSFCKALGASTHNTWNKVTSKTGDDIRVASRKNLNDPGEPLGVILCAVSSVWIPISHHVLFDFLRDENRRNEWDIMSNGGTLQSIANLAKGQDRGNAVSIHAMQQKDNSMWVLQDTCTNGFESMIVYAPAEINGIQSVITGCDSSNIAVLPSGFSILPDGIESRNLVITSRQEEKSTESGSLLTIAFQILTSNSPTAKLSAESVESINSLISCTLHKIKASLNCDDG